MSVAAPDVTFVKQACEECGGYAFVGEDLLEPCGTCEGRGVVFTELVRCRVHGELVARDSHGLLGRCSQCASEAADAVIWLRRNTTGREE